MTPNRDSTCHAVTHATPTPSEGGSAKVEVLAEKIVPLREFRASLK